MNTKTNYITIPLSSIGQRLTVTFCGQQQIHNSLHFNSITTSWTENFLKEVDLYDTDKQKSRIKGLIHIHKEDKIYRIEAHIEFEPLLECVRSLTLFHEKISAVSKCFFTNQAFSTENTAHSTNELNNEICLTEEDLEAYHYRGDSIHLDEFILDLLQTSLPSLPLCIPNCKGLCHTCGINLNKAINCKLGTKEEFICKHFS